MGILELLPFLRKKAPSAFSGVSNHKVKTVAVDTPIFMHKFGYTVGSGRPLCTRMLKFCKDLQERNFDPVFVFDGGYLPEKEGERSKRFEKMCRSFELRKLCIVSIGGDEIEVEKSAAPSTKPIAEDYLAFKLAIENLGIKTRKAKFEAEALCSMLCLNGEVDCVITEDSDALAYLSPLTMLHVGTADEVVIHMKHLLELLHLSQEKFRDFCVLLGNDFNSRIKGVGPVKAFDLIQKFGTLEDCIEGRVCEEQKTQMLATKTLFMNNCHEC
jgi:5'-3' exonuclease